MLCRCVISWPCRAQVHHLNRVVVFLRCPPKLSHPSLRILSILNFVMAETPPRPLPPPPRPRLRRDLPRPLARFRQSSGVSSGSQASVDGAESRVKAGGESSEEEGEEEQPALQPPPRPHAHPLAALLARASDSRAMVSARRLDPAFLNPARVAAFSGKENEPQQSESLSALASGEAHSTRAIERYWRFQLESGSPRGRPPPLTDEELRLAATDAAKLRKEIKNGDGGREQDAGSELARARERKVKKQLDPKWVRTRNDPANRPRRAAERAEERDLYESLGRLSMSEIVRRRQQLEGGGDKVAESRDSSWRPTITHRGFIGMPGSCFESASW